MKAATLDRDGGERRDGVEADDQLERIGGSRERSVEGGGDRTGCAAADERAQIVAAQPEELAEPRGDARADLRIAGFEADRGAGAVRNHVLQGDEEAVGKR